MFLFYENELLNKLQLISSNTAAKTKKRQKGLQKIMLLHFVSLYRFTNYTNTSYTL